MYEEKKRRNLKLAAKRKEEDIARPWRVREIANESIIPDEGEKSMAAIYPSIDQRRLRQDFNVAERFRSKTRKSLRIEPDWLRTLLPPGREGGREGGRREDGKRARKRGRGEGRLRLGERGRDHVLRFLLN